MPPIKGRKASLTEIMAEVALEDDSSEKNMQPGHNKENEQPYNCSLAKNRKKKDKSCPQQLQQLQEPPSKPGNASSFADGAKSGNVHVASAAAGESLDANKKKQQKQQKQQKPILLPKPAYPTTCNAEFCILCGCILTEDMYKRYKNLKRLSTIIRRGCVRTPYVYEYIVNMAASRCSGDFFFNPKTGETAEEQRTVPFCVACINWINRLEKSMKKEFEGEGAGAYSSSVQGPAVFVGICCDDEEEEEEEEEEEGGNESEENASSFCDVQRSSCKEDGDEEDDDEEENEDEEDRNERGAREQSGRDNGLSWAEDDDMAALLMGREGSSKGGEEAAAALQEAIKIDDSDVIPDVERKSSLVFIPLDNLILFLMDPGGLAQPDKRSIGRLLCALCATNLSCCEKSQAEKKSDKPIIQEVANPYRMFCSPISLMILLLFEERYAHKFREIRELKSQPQKDCRGRERRRLCVEGISSEESTALLNDVVAWQWAAIGMPKVLPHAGAAKAVRKALRGGLE